MKATPDNVTPEYVTETLFNAAEVGISPASALKNIRTHAEQVGRFVADWADGHPLWNIDDLANEARAIRKYRDMVMERFHAIGATKDSGDWFGKPLEKDDILKTAP